MTPAPLPGRPGVRPPGGAGEGRERPREARPPAPGPSAPTQSARPGPCHLFPPGLGVPPGCGSTSPRSPVSPPRPFGGRGRCPGKPRLASAAAAAAAKAKAGGGAREEPGTRARTLTRSPSGAQSGADRGRRRWGHGGWQRERTERAGGGRGPARSPWRRRGGDLPLGSGAARRRLAAFRAEGGRQAANGGPAGGLAARPTHLPAAWPAGAAFSAAPAAAPRSAPGLAGALYRAPPPPTPSPGAWGARRAQRGRPTCDTPLRGPLCCGPEKYDSFALLHVYRAPGVCQARGSALGNHRDRNRFF